MCSGGYPLASDSIRCMLSRARWARFDRALVNAHCSPSPPPTTNARPPPTTCLHPSPRVALRHAKAPPHRRVALLLALWAASHARLQRLAVSDDSWPHCCGRSCASGAGAGWLRATYHTHSVLQPLRIARAQAPPQGQVVPGQDERVDLACSRVTKTGGRFTC